MKYSVVVLVGALLCLGCGKPVSRQELLDYISNPENGLTKTIEQGPYEITAVYRPSDLLVEHEIRNSDISNTQLDSVKRNYDKFTYFLLRLSCSNKELVYCLSSDPEKLSRVNEYLSFKIGKDIYLLSAEDTIKTKDFIQTRTFGSGKSTDIIFAFEISRDQKQNDLTLIWDDTILGVGRNEIGFKRSDIRSIPNLMLTKN